MTKSPCLLAPDEVEAVSPYCFRIPKRVRAGMRVDGIIFADAQLMEGLRYDEAILQVLQVAMLPGIVGASMAMPDIHKGYGFCIGGVAATDPAIGGVISPGGVGYDINCGVRLVRSHLLTAEVKKRIGPLMNALFAGIPSGTGRGGPYNFSDKELQEIMRQGPAWLVQKKGLGVPADLTHMEELGCMRGADPELVSAKARERGREQCGTLGSGNHFLELQSVDKVLDERVAARFGLFEKQVCVMIHSGSRGLGHQVCTDYLQKFRDAPESQDSKHLDRQLLCARLDSALGQSYFGAMQAAANYAWANRHLLMVQCRKIFSNVLGPSWEELGMGLIYDLAHNIARLENHCVDGGLRELLVHRKGATRAFAAGTPEIPAEYRDIGHPIIIPGAMGQASWVLVGDAGAMQHSFGSACHGAGRQLSRQASVKDVLTRADGKMSRIADVVASELKSRGIIALARSRRELAEEQPGAYKDVDKVVELIHGAGLAHPVARLKPLGVIKG